MAGGESSHCHIVPTRESHTFRFRVRLPSPEDGRSLGSSSSTVVAGRKCNAFYRTVPRSTHVTLGLSVSKYPALEAAAKVSTHMVLLDKTGSPAPSIGTAKSWDDFFCRFMQGGCFLKAERDDIKAICVLDKDNYFDVLCSVDIDWTPPAEEELPDLGHDLAMMSDKQECTDVSFEVGGETFSAHRVVLAARSPVFKAERYGLMAESKMTTITIQDMDASTFRSMLHYMYHGSLPNNVGKTDVSSIVAEYQHLLVAAARYGVEMLKNICETKLCVYGVTIDSVVSMLELAEDHVCPKLKTKCFDFLSHGENFKMVATTDAYLNLMQTVPSILVEVRNTFKTAHEKPTIIEPAPRKKTRFC